MFGSLRSVLRSATHPRLYTPGSLRSPSSSSPSSLCSLSAGFATSAPRPRSKMHRPVPGMSPSLRDLKPPQRFGMTELDREQFTRDVPVLEARIKAEEVNDVLKSLRGHVVDLPKVKSIRPDPEDSNARRIMLRVAERDALPENVREYLDSIGAELFPHSIHLGYDHWNCGDMLDAVLPHGGGEDTPTGYTQTGHIVHVNLRDEWLPYKKLIGQIILDKVTTCTTVVNKLNTIHAQFRFFDMEVIAGEPNFVAQTNESGCVFEFDFSKVYWNSRLHTEHARLLSQFGKGQVVADAMAGVGPFAVPAARKGCYVLGNDLNPESYKWMSANQRRNKVEARLRTSCSDARKFIQRAPLEAWTNPFPRSEATTAREKALEGRKRKAQLEAMGLKEFPKEDPKPQTIDHFVMNLPDSALEFLDAYAGSYKPLLEVEGYDRSAVKMPLVHVHCFTRELEFDGAQRDICERASGYLGAPVTADMDGFNLHSVRRVAPNKDMYCLTFRLPEAVAYADKQL